MCRSWSIWAVGRRSAVGLAILAFEGVLIVHAGVLLSVKRGTIAVTRGVEDKFSRFCGVYAPTI